MQKFILLLTESKLQMPDSIKVADSILKAAIKLKTDSLSAVPADAKYFIVQLNEQKEGFLIEHSTDIVGLILSACTILLIVIPYISKAKSENKKRESYRRRSFNIIETIFFRVKEEIKIVDGFMKGLREESIIENGVNSGRIPFEEFQALDISYLESIYVDRVKSINSREKPLDKEYTGRVFDNLIIAVNSLHHEINERKRQDKKYIENSRILIDQYINIRMRLFNAISSINNLGVNGIFLPNVKRFQKYTKELIELFDDDKGDKIELLKPSAFNEKIFESLNSQLEKVKEWHIDHDFAFKELNESIEEWDDFFSKFKDSISDFTFESLDSSENLKSNFRHLINFIRLHRKTNFEKNIISF